MRFFIFSILVLISAFCLAQRKSVVAFYNVENLFDTIDQPGTIDEEFLPSSKKQWNSERYTDKVNKLAFIMSQIGDSGTDAPDIIGLAEVENRSVIEDLIKNENLSRFKYGIVHEDSPDARGIDVALIYRKKNFKVNFYAYLKVGLENDSNFKTRDILWVQGKLHGKPIHLFVNHWPSRRGGAEDSEPKRLAASKVLRANIDSILTSNPNAQIIAMGDFNDDPKDLSIRNLMGTNPLHPAKKSTQLENPWKEYLKKGQGSLAYRGDWNLFDMHLYSSTFLSEKAPLKLLDYGVYTREELFQKEGDYMGYPNRTFGGNLYLGGYSDHLPTYLILVY